MNEDEKVKYKHLEAFSKGHELTNEIPLAREEAILALSLLSEKDKKIEELEACLKSFKSHHQATHDALYDYQERNKMAEAKIKKLEEGIEELIAYGMPRYIEEGLQELLEKKGEPK